MKHNKLLNKLFRGDATGSDYAALAFAAAEGVLEITGWGERYGGK